MKRYPNGGTRVTKGNLRSARGDNARAATSEVLHHPHVGTLIPFIMSQVAAVRGRHDRRGFVPGGGEAGFCASAAHLDSDRDSRSSQESDRRQRINRKNKTQDLGRLRRYGRRWKD